MVMFLTVQGLITLTEGNCSFIFCFCCLIVFCVLLDSTLLILNYPHPSENMAFLLTFINVLVTVIGLCSFT
jgi:hypothetical protein